MSMVAIKAMITKMVDFVLKVSGLANMKIVNVIVTWLESNEYVFEYEKVFENSDEIHVDFYDDNGMLKLQQLPKVKVKYNVKFITQKDKIEIKISDIHPELITQILISNNDNEADKKIENFKDFTIIPNMMKICNDNEIKLHRVIIKIDEKEKQLILE